MYLEFSSNDPLPGLGSNTPTLIKTILSLWMCVCLCVIYAGSADACEGQAYELTLRLDLRLLGAT